MRIALALCVVILFAGCPKQEATPTGTPPPTSPAKKSTDPGPKKTQPTQKTDKTEILAMWIMVAVVVLLILAGTGWHMWTHPDWMHGG